MSTKRKQNWFYAAIGRDGPKIYTNWNDCATAVNGFPGARYKKFAAETDALAFLAHGSPTNNINLLLKTPAPAVVKEKNDDFDFTMPAPLLEPSPNKIVIFIDGACKNNQAASLARAAYACVFPDYPDLNTARHLEGSVQTNNRAEFSALLLAHEMAAKLPSYQSQIPLHIYSDSQLLVNTVNKWMSGWKKNGWKLGSGKEPANLDLIKQIDALQRPYIIKHVPAHTGGADYLSQHNAAVDELASSLF